MGPTAAVVMMMVIARPVANMYSQPSRDAEVISQAIYGARVSVLETQPGWRKVRSADDYAGWIADQDLDPHPYAATGREVRVESLFANVYRDPDVARRAPLLTVPFEARLEVRSLAGERWIEVRLVDGATGWVQRGDVAFAPPRLAVSDLPQFARRFLGLPYLWGGTSTLGYDCSGFAQMLYRRAGVMLPRDAQPQMAFAGFEPVERARLRPGDLVYFGPSPGKITHTGLYIGQGEFIDATVHQHPSVRIDRLEDPHWATLYQGARRLK